MKGPYRDAICGSSQEHVSFHANVCVLITTVNLYAEQ